MAVDIQANKSPDNVEICDDKRTDVVHTNRLGHCYIPGTNDTATQTEQDDDANDSTK